MDANGLTFFQLADGARWRRREHARWDDGCRALALSSERVLDAPPDAAALAVALGAVDAVPRAVDRRGAVARWDADASAVVVHSHLAPDAVLLPLAAPPTDLALGADGVLYLAVEGGVLMHDLRGRFADAVVPAPGFAPWRLAPAGPRGAVVVWLIERPGGRIARLSGQPPPLRAPQPDDHDPGVFRPVPEHCRPPRIEVLEGVALPAGERPVAVAAAPDGRLGVLSWRADGTPLLRLLEGGSAAGPGAPAPQDGAGDDGVPDAAYDRRRLAVADAVGAGRAGRRALRVRPGLARRRPRRAAHAGAARRAVVRPAALARRAPRRPAPPPGAAALGEVHPLADDAAEAPFAHRVEGPPRYPLGAAAPAGAPAASSRCWRCRCGGWRAAARRRTGAASGGALDAHLIDSGAPGTVWHRLCAEASIPAGTAFVAWVAATADAEPPADDDRAAWHPHGFGEGVAAFAPADFAGPVPRAAWERAPSELPGHPGLAPWAPEPGRRGLWGVLLQDATRRVRRIAGRYLWLRVELHGDGRATPEIVALRAWAGRFDYVDHYLPRLYRETEYGAAAEAPGVRVATLGAGLPAPRVDEIAAALDAGDASAAALREALAALPAGAGPGADAGLDVRADEAGRRWRLADAAAGRAWHLRARGRRRRHRRAIGRRRRRRISCRACSPASRAC